MDKNEEIALYKKCALYLMVFFYISVFLSALWNFCYKKLCYMFKGYFPWAKIHNKEKKKARKGIKVQICIIFIFNKI